MMLFAGAEFFVCAIFYAHSISEQTFDKIQLSAAATLYQLSLVKW